MSSSGTEKIENLKADIVVIGGGGAGLSAAVAAAEAGVKNVIILEKAPRAGGNTAVAGGLFAVGSPAQERLGIKVSADEVFKEEMRYSHWTTNPRLVRTYINKSGEIIRWLEDKGLRFNEVSPLGFGGKTLMVGHALAFGAFLPNSPGNVGSRAVATLLKNCQDLGIQLLCNTAAKKILTNKEGKMTGVLASSEDKELKITAKSVIVTTGGFGGNKEMLNRYFSIPGDTFSYSSSLPYLTGDGIMMAGELGAATDQILISIIGPHHHPWSLSLNILMQQFNVMYVNKNGERYFDESIYPPDTPANMVRRQPGHIAYALLDEKIKQDVIQKREKVDMGDGEAWIDRLDSDFQKEAAEGEKAKIADSWEEMAEFIGVKPEVLKATVERYNSFCDKGYDEDFAKDKKYLWPLRTPPYYAILGRLGFDTTFGGIKINERMEVVDKEDRPISGLYAGGDNAGGWVSSHYAAFGGTSLCWAFCSGYIAGENAAKYVLGGA